MSAIFICLKNGNLLDGRMRLDGMSQFAKTVGRTHANVEIHFLDLMPTGK
jgi:hypothetical protein